MNIKRILFYLLLGALVLTSMQTNKDSFLLKTEHAPLRIVSLELAGSDTRQAAIFKDWQAAKIYDVVYDKELGIQKKLLLGIEVAKKKTFADLFFIAAYVGFLTLLVYRLKHVKLKIGKTNWHIDWRIGVAVVVAAGLCDVLEDIGIFRALAAWNPKTGTSGTALAIFIPSLIKWALLAVTVTWLLVAAVISKLFGAWLEHCSGVLERLVRIGWKFRIVLAGQLVLFALLTLMNQGQDLLLTINTSRPAVILLIGVTTVLALLNWYFPKLYENARQFKFADFFEQELAYDLDKKFKLDMARILGALTFLVPATAILGTMQAYHISYWLDSFPPVLLLAAILFLYSAALRYGWLDLFFKSGNQFSFSRYLMVILIIAALVTWWGLAGANRQPYYLAYLAIQLILLSFAFLITMTYRTCMKLVAGVPAGPFVLAGGLFVSMMFLAFNSAEFTFCATCNHRFFTLPVVMSAIALYTFFFSCLLVLGKQTKIRFISFLLLTTIAIATISITDFHKVYEVTAEKKAEQPQTLETYIANWLLKRRGEIEALQKLTPAARYPVFFVNAYGGGIKAAAWTTTAVGKLDDTLRQVNGWQHDFQHYVFSYSGASGGTIGLSLLCAARIPCADAPENDRVFSSASGEAIFRNDYLTADIAGLLGRDAWMASLGLNGIADRARLMEDGWELRTKTFGMAYDTPFHAAWSGPAMETPLLFANTYDINTGWKGIVCPVKIDARDFPGTVIVSDLIGSGKDIPLSAAAFLSARFPYISPTGKFNEAHHFTDGGTLENSGAETSLQVITVFNRVVDSLKKVYPAFAAIQVNILTLPNSVAAMDSVERTRNLPELIAPGLGIIKSKDGNTLKAETINRNRAADSSWHYFTLRPTEVYLKEKDLWPVLPLGWQISDDALEMLHRSIRLPSPEFKRLLQQFPGKPKAR